MPIAVITEIGARARIVGAIGLHAIRYRVSAAWRDRNRAVIDTVVIVTRSSCISRAVITGAIALRCDRSANDCAGCESRKESTTAAAAAIAATAAIARAAATSEMSSAAGTGMETATTATARSHAAATTTWSSAAAATWTGMPTNVTQVLGEARGWAQGGQDQSHRGYGTQYFQMGHVWLQLAGLSPTASADECSPAPHPSVRRPQTVSAYLYGK